MQIDMALQGPVSELGARIAAHVVNRWESPPGDDPLLMMLRASMTDPEAAAHMADFFRRQATEPLARDLGGTDAAERAAAVSSLIMGTVIQRYVLGIGPLTATTSDGARACGHRPPAPPHRRPVQPPGPARPHHRMKPSTRKQPAHPDLMIAAGFRCPSPWNPPRS